MNGLLGIYLSIHLLLSLSLVLIWFQRNSKAKQRLKSSYLWIGLSIFLPILLLYAPAESPFVGMARTWADIGQIALLESSVIPQATVQASRSQLYERESLTVFIGFAFLIAWRIFRVFFEFYHVRRLIRRAHVFRQIGNVQIHASDHVITPFSFYDGRAHVVVPSASILDLKRLRMVIGHELQHHRQGDTAWSYLLALVRAIFILNPMIGRLLDRISEIQELACDESLTEERNFSPILYGKCLLEFAEIQKPKCLTGAVGMAVETQFLKRRIQKMLNPKKNTKFSRMILALGLVAMTGTAWALNGIAGQRHFTDRQIEMMAEKLSAGQEIPIVVDQAVLEWIRRATESPSSRRFMRESLARMEVYKPMILKHLRAASLPEALLAVPLVESGYRADARSSVAAGMWQFVPQTARRCGLTVNEQRDERLDPERLTQAAVCYYTKLFAAFQNWHVAMSAYNIGERRMLGAITQQGHNDVLKLAREGHLGEEGGRYLPAILAAMIIMENPSLVD